MSDYAWEKHGSVTIYINQKDRRDAPLWIHFEGVNRFAFKRAGMGTVFYAQTLEEAKALALLLL